MPARPWYYDLLFLLVTAIASFFGGILMPSRPPAPQPPIQQPPIIVQPPQPLPPIPAPIPRADPMAARLRFRQGSVGCTATALRLRDSAGRQYALCAAHCVRGVGSRCQLRDTAGTWHGAEVIATDRRADCSLLLLDTGVSLPFANVATAEPTDGTRIWHAGYGVHAPGNTERGVTRRFRPEESQGSMRLSVSSGDSGSGIFREDTGEIVSVVCCSGSGLTYGPTVARIRGLVRAYQAEQDEPRADNESAVVGIIDYSVNAAGDLVISASLDRAEAVLREMHRTLVKAGRRASIITAGGKTTLTIPTVAAPAPRKD